MSNQLKFRLFAHSWVSDWNHGNAHFLRGLARELVRRGHKVRCYEELGAWSLANLVREDSDAATKAIEEFRRLYPELDVRFYQFDTNFESFLEEELRDADFVILHEWNKPSVVNAVLAKKAKFQFHALLHDTHHRAYTNAAEILKFDLTRFDGVLAFGEPIRKLYQDGFGVARAWTFHEAADLSTFHPVPAEKEIDIIWVGNWGDEERTNELREFLIEPAKRLQPENARVRVHGVRYPEHAIRALRSAGIDYCGYLSNLSVPLALGRSKLSVHIPRRHYTNGLSGIPTIRVFEVLACGTPLVCSPWSDEEHLFRPGEDYLIAESGAAMLNMMKELLRDETAARQIAANGLSTIRQRHSCSHRAEQLLDICGEVNR